jgi:hypothetical protein
MKILNTVYRKEKLCLGIYFGDNTLGITIIFLFFNAFSLYFPNGQTDPPCLVQTSTVRHQASAWISAALLHLQSCNCNCNIAFNLNERLASHEVPVLESEEGEEGADNWGPLTFILSFVLSDATDVQI